MATSGIENKNTSCCHVEEMILKLKNLYDKLTKCNGEMVNMQYKYQKELDSISFYKKKMEEIDREEEKK